MISLETSDSLTPQRVWGIAAILLVCSGLVANGQTFMQLVDVSGGDDQCIRSAQVADGRLLCVGFASVPTYTGWIMMIDASGVPMWQRAYGDGFLGDAKETKEGFVLVGDTYRVGELFGDAWILRVDSHGDVLRQTSLGGSEFDRFETVQVSASGQIFVAGRTDSVGNGDFWLLEFDDEGSLVWEKTYGVTDEFDVLLDMIPTADGGFLMVGQTTFGADYRDHALAIKTDSFGQVEWWYVYSLLGDETFDSVVELPAGGFIAVGRLRGTHSITQKAWIVRLDAQGNIVWQQYLPAVTNGSGRFRAVDLADDGDIVAVGELAEGWGASDLWIVKVSAADGTMVWQRRYGGASREWARAVHAGGGRGISAVGHSRSFVPPAGDDDLLVMRADFDGRIASDCLIQRDTAEGVLVEEISVEPFPGIVGQVPELVAVETDAVSEALPIDTEQPCAGETLFPPTGVSPRVSLTPLVFTSRSRLEWEHAGASGSEVFDLYRGDTAGLAGGAAGEGLVAAHPDSHASDELSPPQGSAWFYVVAGRNAVGSGSLGRGSDGTERQPSLPCE
ncbi:MAG: hypothetical protein JSV80_10585 [Acidobacteriota bacterium]|nr:MAG: hypothetical protein JSV80_10585 [Acidobacteriota bacterium]